VLFAGTAESPFSRNFLAGGNMKKIIGAIACCFMVIAAASTQAQDTTFKFIFVPHVRSEDATNQTVNAGIAKIDFTKYSLKLLGGDLAPQTSKSEKTMKYLDSLFDLKNPNTLWTLGNHDLEEGDSNLIKKYTGRQLYYSYYRDGITFLVLNTEAGAEGFNRTFIKSPQLDTVKAVCERVTSETTKFLIVLHSRYMWMINNPYFTQKMKDSIAASSKSMDTTNFYSDIYPLLQKVQKKGIQVMVFGGDKSQINVSNYIYNKTDSITFYAARMENTFTDSVNNVIVLTYVKNKKMTCTYVTLKNVNNQATGAYSFSVDALDKRTAGDKVVKIQGNPRSNLLTFMLLPGAHGTGVVNVFSLDGALCREVSLSGIETKSMPVPGTGMYIIKASAGSAHQLTKIVVQ
jgi:hypothetical protein